MIFGVLDATKSFLIGLLLAIFQITATEEIRLPIIGIMEKIAAKKAEIDGTLVEAGMSARGDELAPTFQDLNNLQALMDDPAFICSTEYEQLIEKVDQSQIIHMVLELMRIPVTKEFRKLRCGDQPSKPFLSLIENESKEEPVEPVEPVEPKEEPVESKEEPEEPKEEPVEPKEEPMEPKEEPVEPKEEPVEPKEEPVEPKEEPVEPVEPVEPKEEPVEEPVEPKEEPVESEVLPKQGGTHRIRHRRGLNY